MEKVTRFLESNPYMILYISIIIGALLKIIDNKLS